MRTYPTRKSQHRFIFYDEMDDGGPAGFVYSYKTKKRAEQAVVQMQKDGRLTFFEVPIYKVALATTVKIKDQIFDTRRRS